MKLNFSLLDKSLSIDGTTIVVVEPTQVFANLVRDFHHYTEDGSLRIFDEKQQSLKSTELLLVTDILGFEVNSAPVLKKVYADLENQFNDKPEVKSQLDGLMTSLTKLIVDESLENELDLTYDDLTLSGLMKALGLRIETQNMTLFDKCFDIIQVFKYLTKKKLLVFVNSGAYLTREEVYQLLDYIQLSQVRVLFLEPQRLYDFPQYILDEDYFLISENML